jgi:hypothetical protein
LLAPVVCSLVVLVPVLSFRAGSCLRTHYRGLCGWSRLSSLSGSSSGRLLFSCSRTSSWGWSVFSLLLLVEGSRLPLHLLLVVRLFPVLRLGLVLRPGCPFSGCRGFSCSALKWGTLRYLARVCSSSSSARSFTFWPLVSFAVLSL